MSVVVLPELEVAKNSEELNQVINGTDDDKIVIVGFIKATKLLIYPITSNLHCYAIHLNWFKRMSTLVSHNPTQTRPDHEQPKENKFIFLVMEISMIDDDIKKEYDVTTNSNPTFILMKNKKQLLKLDPYSICI